MSCDHAVKHLSMWHVRGTDVSVASHRFFELGGQVLNRQHIGADLKPRPWRRKNVRLERAVGPNRRGDLVGSTEVDDPHHPRPVIRYRSGRTGNECPTAPYRKDSDP